MYILVKFQVPYLWYYYFTREVKSPYSESKFCITRSYDRVAASHIVVVLAPSTQANPNSRLTVLIQVQMDVYCASV